MLVNMNKMAAPSGLPSGYFISPYLLNKSSDFNFVFTVRKTFLFYTKFIDFGRSSPYGRLFVTFAKLKTYVYHSQIQDELTDISNRNREACSIPVFIPSQP